MTSERHNEDAGARGGPQPAPVQRKARAILRLLRPRQWVKNAFVIAPLLFSGRFHHPESVRHAVQGMLIFTLASCLVYVLNDLHDLEADRQHPTKRYTRPIASSAVSVNAGRALLVFLGGALVAAVLTVRPLAPLIAAYIALNVVYSLKLKQVPVLDLFCIAAGFVLRVYSGAVAISVPLSSWMLITTLALALYLAAIKRRDELGRAGPAARAVLGSYTPGLLDRYALIAAASAIIFYSLFVMTVRPGLVITIPLVLFGLFRYWFIVETMGAAESPTDALWRDIPLSLTVLGWALLSAAHL